MSEAIERHEWNKLGRASRNRLMLWVSAGLMVVLQLPLAGWAIPGERLAAQVEREGVYWALTALLVIYIARMERRPLSSVGLRAPTWKSFAFGVVGGLVMLAGIIALYTWVMPQLGSTSSAKQLSTVRALPLWFRIGIVVRAAIFEELFYRGFMIERLTELTGLRWVAAILSIAAFTYAHVGFWGWGHLLIAGFGG